MPQPIKKSGTYQKPRSKTVKKRRKPTVSEMIKRNIARSKRTHPKYGTSKLEEKFAKEFLDKLGVKYIYQFNAKEIGRFYDFRIFRETAMGIIKGPIIELQGSYWHGDPRLYEEKDLNIIQKKNKRIDEVKQKWCIKNKIKLIYLKIKSIDLYDKYSI